jgi:WD40 repeat protein
VSHPPPSAQRSFGDYELLHEIARGGMGVVYKARHRQLDRLVALKMILAGSLAGEDDVRRFHAEAEAAAQLDHSGIVPVHEVGEIEGLRYLAMAYVDGCSLKQRLTEGPLLPSEAAELAASIAEAIDYAHSRGIIHRDIKPANVLLDTTGKPRVTDFGLAKRLGQDSGLTATGQIIGTPNYMPPEQARGNSEEIGPLADVYSLGASLYHLLTGRPPFQAATIVDTLAQVVTQEPARPREINPAIPQDLETICLKCLEKVPARRYRSAGDVAGELRRFLAGLPIAARPVGRAERTWRWCRRNPAFAGALAMGVLVLVLGLLTWHLQNQSRASRHAAEQAAKIAQQSQELANLQRGFSLTSQARETALRRDLGWSWQALALLEEAATLGLPSTDDANLRALVAACVNGHDLREVAVVADGVIASSLDFSRDGRWLAVAEQKKATGFSIFIYDTETRELYRQLRTNPAATFFANASRLLQGETNRFQDGFTCVAFDPDARSIAAGTRFGQMYLWPLADSDSEPQIISAHENSSCQHLKFLPDGTGLISSQTNPPAIRVWQVTEDGAKLVRTHADVGPTFAIHPEGEILLAGSGRLRRFSLLDGQEHPHVKEYPVEGIALSHDGRLVVTNVGEEMHWRSSEDGEQTAVFGAPGQATTTDMRTFASRHPSQLPSNGSIVVTSCEDQTVRMRDVLSGEVLASTSAAGRNAPPFAISADGRWLAVSENHLTRLYEMRTNRYETVFPVARHALHSAALSADGRRLAWLDAQGGEGCFARTSWGVVDVESKSVLREQFIENLQHVCVRRDRFSQPTIGFDASGTRIAVSGLLEGARIESLDGCCVIPQQHAATMPSGLLITADRLQRPAPEEKLPIVEDSLANSGRALLMDSLETLRVRLPESAYQADPAWPLAVLVRVRGERNSAPTHCLEFQYGSRNAVGCHLVSDGRYHWFLVALLSREELRINQPIELALGKCSADAGPAIYWDCVALVPFRPAADGRGYMSLAHGPLTLSGDAAKLWAIVGDDQLSAWSGSTGELLATYSNRPQALGTNNSRLSALAVRQKSVVVGTALGQLLIVDPESAAVQHVVRALHHLGDKGEPVTCIAISHDESRVAHATSYGSIQIHQLNNGEAIGSLPKQATLVSQVAFGAASSILWTGNRGGEVTAWRTTDPSPLLRLPRFHGPILALSLSDDGHSLMIAVEGEHGMRLFDLQKLRDSLERLNLPSPVL